MTHCVLLVIHHATRMVEIAGVTPNPGGNFMTQVDGFLRDEKFLTLGDAACEVVRTAIRAPNMNAFAERFVQTVKRECLSELILFGEGHLRRALSEFTAHCHEQRPHQSLDNKLITPTDYELPNGHRVVVDERLGGLRRNYRRSA